MNENKTNYGVSKEIDIYKMQNMIRNAWDFQETAYRCKEPMITKTTGVVKVLFIAEMSSLAFASEIYLKTIYYIFNKKEYKKEKKETGHELELIFNRLDETLKSCIISKSNYSRGEFLKELKVNSDFFIKWRYYHQYIDTSSPNIIKDSFLLNFCNILYETCIKMEKEILMTKNISTIN